MISLGMLENNLEYTGFRYVGVYYIVLLLGLSLSC
jgi:hypothetical protein